MGPENEENICDGVAASIERLVGECERLGRNSRRISEQYAKIGRFVEQQRGLLERGGGGARSERAW